MQTRAAMHVCVCRLLLLVPASMSPKQPSQPRSAERGARGSRIAESALPRWPPSIPQNYGAPIRASKERPDPTDGERYVLFLLDSHRSAAD
jgi:hypothetical protein